MHSRGPDFPTVEKVPLLGVMESPGEIARSSALVQLSEVWDASAGNGDRLTRISVSGAAARQDLLIPHPLESAFQRTLAELGADSKEA
ncbi:MAG: hypothetical protein M3252_01395 [Actinomycetota bacterium]|nr:hypothetical protein [Actinomycetota bacterium]